MPAIDERAARVAEFVFGEGADRACRDIPESACREQPRNVLLHVASLTSTKIGDGLLDPKLVLPWLVGAIGGPAAATGLLVPVREAFALLPQLFLGHRVRRLPVRKHVWALAAAAQGLAVVGIGIVALLLEGALAAWLVVALLLVFALARSCASVSYKDVLGKTVGKSRRGRVTGTATSAAAAVVLAFGAALALGWIPLTVRAIATAVIVGGALWLFAAALFSRLVEEPGASDGGAEPGSGALASLGLLRQDAQLARFVVTRSLLTVTAIAPPFLLELTAAGDRRLGELGPFVVAAGVATIVGGRVWGRWSDRSSRKVLMGAAAASAVLFGVAAAGASLDAAALAEPWIASALLFLVVLAYQGVRLGRSTHLVDMADEDRRAVYTAASNTVVGVVILLTGAFGVLSQWIGLGGLFAVFALASTAALVAAKGLEEVQGS